MVIFIITYSLRSPSFEINASLFHFAKGLSSLSVECSRTGNGKEVGQSIMWEFNIMCVAINGNKE